MLMVWYTYLGVPLPSADHHAVCLFVEFRFLRLVSELLVWYTNLSVPLPETGLYANGLV